MTQTRLRRTKIVATLGPATNSPEVLSKMIAAGLDVVRVNFSHGEAKDHVRNVEMVRECARKQNREVGVLADLQGPKIRIDRFVRDKVQLEEGARFILDTNCPADAGNEERVGLAYKELPNDVSADDILLLDDGNIVLKVLETSGEAITCEVQVAGELSNNKGINLQGGGLSAAAITDKDRADIKIAAEIKADYVAVSFPRNAADIHEARELLREAGGHGSIVAKIERAESLHNIEEIIAATDVVMIARGDLGVEIGDAELPGVQKNLIHMARTMNRIVITATQMMQSMVTHQIPTRAEVFDVANAVLDGTDAVMLSQETATGNYPVKVVAAMARICIGAEGQKLASQNQRHRVSAEFNRIDEAIAMASMYTANHLGVRAIAALTESGSSAQWMSRISSGIPIYAMTRHEATRRKVTLYRGVYPVDFDVTASHHVEVNNEVIRELLRRGTVQEGDLVIITKGDLAGVHGGTNTMKILRAEKM